MSVAWCQICPFPGWGVNNQRVGELAAEHFLQRGLQSFGFVGHSRFRYSTEREQAFCKTLSAAGYSTSVWHCDHLSTFDNTGRKTMLNGRVKNWLSELPRPTGILAAFDSWAADLLQFCHEIQIDVPDETRRSRRGTMTTCIARPRGHACPQ